eukprot:5476140-Prymnesium_polylepis.1
MARTLPNMARAPPKYGMPLPNMACPSLMRQVKATPSGSKDGGASRRTTSLAPSLKARGTLPNMACPSLIWHAPP